MTLGDWLVTLAGLGIGLALFASYCHWWTQLWGV
jgi:hypothetical protein